MRILRMTTQRWMVAVSILALTMGGATGAVRLYRRHQNLYFRFKLHDVVAATLARGNPSMDMVDSFRVFTGIENGRPVDRAPTEAEKEEERQRMARLLRVIDYHSQLARKYERAARYPWLPVEPDPPEPE